MKNKKMYVQNLSLNAQIVYFSVWAIKVIQNLIVVHIGTVFAFQIFWWTINFKNHSMFFISNF